MHCFWYWTWHYMKGKTRTSGLTAKMWHLCNTGVQMCLKKKKETPYADTQKKPVSQWKHANLTHFSDHAYKRFWNVNVQFIFILFCVIFTWFCRFLPQSVNLINNLNCPSFVHVCVCIKECVLHDCMTHLSLCGAVMERWPVQYVSCPVRVMISLGGGGYKWKSGLYT